MEKLHPRVKWIFRVNSYSGLLFFALFFIFLVFGISAGEGVKIANGFFIFPIGLIFFVIIVELFVHLTYINWKYEFTPNSLKIEKGVIIKSYKSIPYERVQNVDITRGILARILGLSSIEIQTAGYSMHYNSRRGGHSEGHLPGLSVEAAEHIREFLMKKISGKKSSGL